MPGDVQGNVRILIWLLHLTNARNSALWSEVSSLLIAGVLWACQDDSARPYVTHVVQNCPQAYPTLPRQSRSHDLSLIEHILDVWSD
ncbi:hypothetical protein TNCV_2425311 [Trichonephila clavipes]|nr:hypothetical protein TNCV_2425311 [Trichonephila clavipes]